MKKIAFLMIVFMALLYSCATSSSSSNLGTKSKRLQIGMTKNEAVSVMGKNYNLINVTKTAEGNMETLRYISSWPPNYILHFLDDSLVEWREEK